MADFDDWWTYKYGPDPADVAVERQRERMENEPLERDYEEEAYNHSLAHEVEDLGYGGDECGELDEDHDVDEAKLAAYDERDG